MSKIEIDYDGLEDHYLLRKKYDFDLDVVGLKNKDNKTTLTANEKGQEAFDDVQNTKEYLKKCLETEAKNIKIITQNFKDCDENAAKLFGRFK